METVVAGKLNWACSFGRSLDVGGHNLLPVLEALGRARRNTVKYFATVRLLAACADEAWLGRVTVALTRSRQKPIKDSSDQLEDAGRDTAT